MKKQIALFLTLVLCYFLFADGTPPEGTGTENDPYQIETLDNLLWLSTTEAVWDSTYYFLQTADIDASDTQNWNEGAGLIPLGIFNFFENIDIPFQGSYIGDDHIIDGLVINRPDKNDVALFGYATGAVIESVCLTNVHITGNQSVGGLVGRDCGSNTIRCSASGDVTGVCQVGGLIGLGGSTISECYAACNVNGDINVSGLIGESYNITISECYYNYETVLINDQHIISTGALTDELFNDWISNNRNLEITDYLILDGENYLINNLEDFTTLLAFGQNPEYDFLLTANINLANNPEFFIPYFQGTFNGDYHIIDGLNVNSPHICCIGLFAYTDGAEIKALGVTNFAVYGDDYIGGLVGWNIESTIRECYSDGSATGDFFCGGLVGKNYQSVISNCYTTGSVNGHNCVGGLSGTNSKNSIINNCYTICSITGSRSIGGFVGRNYISEITNNIWNPEISGLLIGFGANQNGTITNLLGLTTAEMQIMSTFTDIGWDFVDEEINGLEDIWEIDNTVNNGFPFISELGWSVGGIFSNFSAFPTSGFSPLTVNFVDESVLTDTLVTWQWDFENDGIIDSYEQNPIWVFEEPGAYSVNLSVIEEVSGDTLTTVKTDYIMIFTESSQPQGNGTEISPYLIETLNNLVWVGVNESSWGSNFLQIADIDASASANWLDGTVFNPIGNLDNPFQGIYNGNNHFIDGLKISRFNSNCIGLFGYADCAFIDSLSVTNINIRGSDWVGGLVGKSNNTSVSACYAEGCVSGNIDIGGLAGYNYNGSSIFASSADCIVTGNVCIGGLTGGNVQSTLSACYATGYVSGNSEVGGLAGTNRFVAIDQCYAIGNVSGTNFTGALVGTNYTSSISDCVWNIETSGQTTGIGENIDPTILNLVEATTAEMHTMSTYTDINWDFVGESINGTEDIWDIDSAFNNGYPFISDLKWSVDVGENELPGVETISAVYASPNPFNPETKIVFNLTKNSYVRLDIYNIKGQLVRNLVNENLPAATHQIIWNGTNRQGLNVSSGVYFCVVQADGSAKSNKLLLLK